MTGSITLEPRFTSNAYRGDSMGFQPVGGGVGLYLQRYAVGQGESLLHGGAFTAVLEKMNCPMPSAAFTILRLMNSISRKWAA